MEAVSVQWPSYEVLGADCDKLSNLVVLVLALFLVCSYVHQAIARRAYGGHLPAC